ncbi:MAG: xanthine dehydrogenase small subunit [Beijerinckiaceae bacterium]|nr:xanthine dehydrogenase small subunit [Beijerinckiaceae bacterium]
MTDAIRKDISRDHIRFLHRGAVVALGGFSPRRTLLDWLREDQRLTGTKEGCAEGDCGACTVVLGRLRHGRLVYEPVNACILLLGQIDGCELITVDDLARDGALHPVQAAMVAHHGSQCGFCTPGIVMSLFALYQEAARPVTRAAICDALAGNLCRCTGYRPILDAAFAACASEAADRFMAARQATAAQLQALADDAADVMVGHQGGFFAIPRSQDALASLALDHPEATLLAGGTDVGLWLTKGLMALERIIWLGAVEGFSGISDEPGGIRIGAGTSHADAHAALAALDPDLGEVMRRFGSAQVRASGTVGGNIANGSPIGDLAPCFIALGATVDLRRGDAVRRLALEDFFLAYRKQDRGPSEFVSALHVPRLADGQIFRAYKVSKRFDEDISAVMGAFRFSLAGNSIMEARIAFGGMAGTPRRALLAEAALAGVSLADEAGWGAALDALAEDYQPLTDQRASSAYRRKVARNLLLKALTEVAGTETGLTRLIAHRGALEAVR